MANKLPFSPFVEKKGFIFTSGQIHLKDGELLQGTVEEKTHQVMRNLEGVLKKAGVTFKDVVQTFIYVTDMSIYEKVNEVYITYLSEPFPARVTVGVKELPLGADIEISMVVSK